MATKQATPPGQAAVNHDEEKSKYDYEFASGWKPEPGAVVEGEITSIDTGKNEFGAYPILTIKQVDGESQAVHCFHTALRSQLARVQPQVGMIIGIKYLGKQQSKNPVEGRSDYDNYRVIMPEGGGGYDWSQEASVETDAA